MGQAGACRRTSSSRRQDAAERHGNRDISRMSPEIQICLPSPSSYWSSGSADVWQSHASERPLLFRTTEEGNSPIRGYPRLLPAGLERSRIRGLVSGEELQGGWSGAA